MAYFNYFVKCIIRKFVNLIFKPKVFLTFLVILAVIFVFQASAHAEWTDTQISDVQTKLLQITEKMNQQISYLEWINGECVNMRNQLVTITSQISSLNSYAESIQSKVNDIRNQLVTLNDSISSMHEDIMTNQKELIEKLDTNQQELLNALDEDNKQVLEELNMIRDAINGTENEPTTYECLGTIIPEQGSYQGVAVYTLDYESRYTYTIKMTCKNVDSFTKNVRVYCSDNLYEQGFDINDFYNNSTILGSLPQGGEGYVFYYVLPSSNLKYIYIGSNLAIQNIEVTRSIKGIVESLKDANSLQQQQNQLQQEQNNFLKQDTSDSDVSIDGFSNIDSNDITSSGLTGIFNTIYNSISSWNSKDISLPIPFTNKSILIPANSVESALQRSGATWVLNLIHAVYYFIVSRFMIYSITNIVNSIKGGNILNTGGSNNITTDML